MISVLFNGEICRWTVLGEAGEVHRSETRSKILNVLKAATEPITPPDIGFVTDLQDFLKLCTEGGK